MSSSFTPRVVAMAVVNAARASSSGMSLGIVTDMVPEVTYSVTLVTSLLSTPYASATRASKSLISESSNAAVAVRLTSTETTNPKKDGEIVGVEVTGDWLGNSVGADVMNVSQQD